MAATPRLFIEYPLSAGVCLELTREHSHYLLSVMRLAEGAQVLVFNGTQGEWACTLTQAGKRSATLEVQHQSRPQHDPPDLWLCFAPIKKARTDFIVEKAAEMGAARIMPVMSAYTNATRVRQDRLQAHAVEAAEQCGGTFVPEVAPLTSLSDLLATWPSERGLLFCDEAKAGDAPALPPRAGAAPWAILIGPEGGFSDGERAAIAKVPSAHAISLGPRILRADTAAVAALALWQWQLGDWNTGENPWGGIS